MPNRIHASPTKSPTERTWLPLPHPSWSGEAAAQLARPLAAADFWKRLGL